MTITSRVIRWPPTIAKLRSYQLSWLRGDLVAGATVTAYLVPQVMACAMLAGMPPLTALWGAVSAQIAYVLFGTSSRLSVGPESSTALLTGTVLIPVAGGDIALHQALAAVLAGIVGLICLVASLARLGFLANLLSRPILIGYITGIAAVMLIGQIGAFTAVALPDERITTVTQSIPEVARGIHTPTLILAVSVLCLLFALDKWAPKLPGPAIAVVAATALVSWKSDWFRGTKSLQNVPEPMQSFGLPHVSSGHLSALVLPAIGISIVAFSDAVLTARAFAARDDAELNPNTELRALGIANAAAGLVHAFPVSASATRTGLARAVGGKTQLYSIIVVMMVSAVALFGRNVLSHIPVAVLGALVVYAAVRMIDVAQYRRLARFRRSELVPACATTLAVLGFGVLNGVLVAVGLSILDLLRRIAHAHDSVLGFVPGLAGMHDLNDYATAAPLPGLVVYRYDAPLCFANAQDFHKRALAAVDRTDGHVEWFILNAEANVEVDLTALDALDQLREDLAQRGIVFSIARVKQHLRDALAAAGLLARIGEDRIFPTLPTAVDAFRHR
ncbi:SulP family inorganic anion transporter [Mycobacterium sp. PDNC021]|uniref:SulP family inorganic anion transporter n=1 Tax=Mycobacterium sp. PDNC021 TaxID=3391399 RepID=UPI003AADEDF8